MVLRFLKAAKRTPRRCTCHWGFSFIRCEMLLPKDYDGTLKEIGSIGFREVESAGYYDHSAAQVKQAMSERRVTPGERALLLRQFASAAR